MLTLSVIALLLFVLAHLFTARLRFLEGLPRNAWLSFAGGVSVAYVFVHLLPELNESREAIAQVTGRMMGFTEHHEYLVALAGLAVFYGLDRWAKVTRGQRRRQDGEDLASPEAFWVHLGSYAAYSLLIGYLLLDLDQFSTMEVLLYAVALSLHFVVTNFGFLEDYKYLWLKYGRWVAAGAVTVGWLIAVFSDLPRGAVAILLAFLAGGILINVFKEELPAERESRYWPFLGGVVGYAALLVFAG